QDFTTGSWSLFADNAQFICLNTARFDATKHLALPVVGDARNSIEDLTALLSGWRASTTWMDLAKSEYQQWNEFIDVKSGPTNAETPTYAHVVGAVNRLADDTDLALTAAGGLPGELCMNWRARQTDTFDCEFGFSCMGYEIAGGWGAKMSKPERDVIVLVGDGSYLMLNSDIYSSVLTGHKLIIVVCDNGGFAVIDRLQVAKGIPSFNNLLSDCRVSESHSSQLPRVDFVRHAEAMGAIGIRVSGMGEFEQAFKQAKAADRTTVIHVDVQARDWTEGNGAWWECGTPETSPRETVRDALEEHRKGKTKQRQGV
ncbi:MAG: thiamine pyrophosphate-dependent enzyme, partial [Pseudomonadota bacterium]